jgi:lipopolysaccharide transport system permease protein
VLGYLRNVWRLRHFWLALVTTDLRRRYRRSVLGVGWSLLHPIAMAAVLCTVFSTLFAADVRTYGPFLLAGLVTWNFVVGVMAEGCRCFLDGESYIRQYPAPLAIYPLRTTLGAGIHFLLGLGVVVVMVWCLNGLSNLPALASLVPSLVMLFVVGWSVAACMGVINVMFQDTQHLIEVLVQILFYVTPIIYPAELLQKRGLGWFVAINPAATFLELIRAPILDGAVPSPATFALGAAAALIAAGLAALTLWKTERRLVFYL